MFSKICLIFVISTTSVLNTNAGGPVYDCTTINDMFSNLLDSYKQTLKVYEASAKRAINNYAINHLSQSIKDFEDGVHEIANNNFNEILDEAYRFINTVATILDFNPLIASNYFIGGTPADYPLKCLDDSSIQSVYLKIFDSMTSYGNEIISNHK